MKQQASNLSSWIAIGYVAKPFGIKGGLKLHLPQGDGEIIKSGSKIALKKIDQNHITIFTVRTMLKNNSIFVQEISSRNDAELWRQARVMVLRDELPQLNDDEIYLIDLLGNKVIDKDGHEIGELQSISSNNAQVLLNIALHSGKVVSVPYVKEIVLKIDDADKIIIDPPKGLLEC